MRHRKKFKKLKLDEKSMFQSSPNCDVDNEQVSGLARIFTGDFYAFMYMDQAEIYDQLELKLLNIGK